MWWRNVGRAAEGKRRAAAGAPRSFCRQLIPAEEEEARCVRRPGGRRQFAGRGRLANFSSAVIAAAATSAETEGDLW